MKELGADIATVIRSHVISRQDFLDLTRDEIKLLFPRIGQMKTVLQLILSKTAATSMVCM